MPAQTQAIDLPPLEAEPLEGSQPGDRKQTQAKKKKA
jgi:hypothetical protein